MSSTLPALSKSLTRYKLIFYVPPSSLQACKTAIFAAGAGRHPSTNTHLTLSNPTPGNPTPGTSSSSNPSAEQVKYTYTECCFTTLGTGQFRPGDGANPHLGTVGELGEVEEARCEVLCCVEDGDGDGGKEEMRGIVGALRE